MKLIVGLGNPGNEYTQTRHNVGFMVLERLAQKYGMTGAKQKFHAGVLEGHIGTEKVMLMQPMTFMNRSGLSVSEAMQFYKLSTEDLMIVVDDTALDVGFIRLRSAGSAGGHNGLSDIQRSIGSSKYPRLRVGVGKPEVNGHKIPLKDYVLGRFSEEQMQKIDPTLDTCCKAIACWIDDGVEDAMNQFNTPKETTTQQEKVSCDNNKSKSQAEDEA